MSEFKKDDIYMSASGGSLSTYEVSLLSDKDAFSLRELHHSHNALKNEIDYFMDKVTEVQKLLVKNKFRIREKEEQLLLKIRDKKS